MAIIIKRKFEGRSSTSYRYHIEDENRKNSDDIGSMLFSVEHGDRENQRKIIKIETLYVYDEHRNKGNATRLLKEAIKDAHNLHNSEYVELYDSSIKHGHQTSIYVKLGLKYIGESRYMTGKISELSVFV